MFWFVLAGPIAVAVGVVVGYFMVQDKAWKNPEPKDWVFGSLVGLLTAAVLAFFLSIVVAAPLCKLGSGLWPDYSVGERTGYVTKLSYTGVIWKTWEVELQVGTGQMAALQAPHEFSVPDLEPRTILTEFVGTPRRVRVQYRQWGLQPYRRGASGYEIIGIEAAPE